MIVTTGQTHFAAGIASMMLFQYITKQPFQTDLILISGLIGLVADIDQEGSTAGKLFRPISYIFDKFRDFSTKTKNKYLINIFEHRGITHTLLIPVLIFLLWYKTGQDYLFASMVGYLSHLIMDINNDRGIPIFHPFSFKKVHLLTISTGGKKVKGKQSGINVENLVCGGLWAIVIIILLKIDVTVIQYIKDI